MEVLICILLPAVSFLIGSGVLRVLYGSKQELVWQDAFLTGGIVIIGLAEAVHVAVAFLHQPLYRGALLFCVAIAVCAMVSLVIMYCKRERNKKRVSAGNELSVKEQLLFLTFGGLVLLQVVYVAVELPVYLNGDMTLETVQSFIETNTAYQVNPMTGQAYEQGIPSRLKLLCLPTLYAVLSNVFRIEAMTMVWVLVPIFTLVGCYLVYSILAQILFPANRWQRGCFLMLVALIFWVGDYMLSVDGFNLLHSGFRGVTIRGAILVPYTVALVLRKKWKLVVLCVLAEACIVWTLYGMGACLFVSIALFVTGRMMKCWRKHKAGREDATCRNS